VPTDDVDYFSMFFSGKQATLEVVSKAMQSGVAFNV
jgi:hypothetical protein